ncbi:type II secretion system F family protein [Desulfotruncus arcticus]|nr:type II secretion system F family protein [Desulfotruncus arcticus]
MLSRTGSTEESLKALDKRLRALNIPVSGEMFAALKTAVTTILLIAGAIILSSDLTIGAMLLIIAYLVWKMSYRLLELLEKRKRKELVNDFTFMVNQVRIYTKAADLYQAMKIVPYTIKGEMGRELRLLSADMEMSPLTEALDSFAKRCGIKEAEYFTQIVLLGIRMGADVNVDKVLSSYAKMLHQRRVGKIKRWIKLQPILITILPALLLWIFMLMFIVPFYTDIIGKMSNI